MQTVASTRGGGPDVAIVGAGIVGAACALSCAIAGLRVVVLDRGAVAGGTTGRGEGNLLLSDKLPGPELDLAVLSLRIWYELAEHLADLTGRPGGGIELEPKGGLVVAAEPTALPALLDLAEAQRPAGVHSEAVTGPGLTDREPELAAGLAGGVFYPQDSQLQPMLAAASLLAAARRHGAGVQLGHAVTGFLRGRDGRVTGVRTSLGDLPAGQVVNAAGAWSGELAALAGVTVPILPRRGVILVTQPLPPLIRHKVYTSAYTSDVVSDQPGLESSAVIEGTPAGTVLIGASRERVGFDPELPVPVLARLAAQAVQLFPVLARARVIRAYGGFRPYCPDHLPVIGADPRVPGLVHACGHEGAGIGLAAATGRVVAQVLAGAEPDLDLTPLRPERFEPAAGSGAARSDP